MPTAARTKKSKAIAEVASAPAPVAAPAEATAPATETPAHTPVKKKAAPKKPVKVVAVVTPDGIEGSFQPEPRRPLIAHLNIKPSEVQFNDGGIKYNPNPLDEKEPEPFDASSMNMFVTSAEPLLVAAAAKEDTSTAPAAATVSVPAESETPSVAVTAATAAPCFKRWDLMTQFRGSNELCKLPDTTEIACFWCVHTFEGMPCVVPEREVNGVYTVYGNFCSPHCAVSFLLGENIDPHVRWERMALLHRVYDPLGAGRIFPAPARESLTLFGGPMEIGTFRATAAEKRVRVDVHMPPMVSILGSIDTKPIDFFDTTVKGPAIVPGGPSAPTRSVEEGLRLKRTKPLKDRESTLDSVMSIKIGGVRGRA